MRKLSLLVTLTSAALLIGAGAVSAQQSAPAEKDGSGAAKADSKKPAGPPADENMGQGDQRDNKMPAKKDGSGSADAQSKKPPATPAAE